MDAYVYPLRQIVQVDFDLIEILDTIANKHSEMSDADIIHACEHVRTPVGRREPYGRHYAFIGLDQQLYDIEIAGIIEYRADIGKTVFKVYHALDATYNFADELGIPRHEIRRRRNKRRRKRR